jgi:hypothetical protein
VAEVLLNPSLGRRGRHRRYGIAISVYGRLSGSGVYISLLVGRLVRETGYLVISVGEGDAELVYSCDYSHCDN